MSKDSSRLSLTPAFSGDLGPGQKHFNKLLRELEALRERINKRTLLLEQELKAYAEHYAKAKRAEDNARLRLMLCLGEFWRQNRYLRKGQAPLLRDLIIHMKVELADPTEAFGEGPIGDLSRELFEDWKKSQGFEGESEESLAQIAADAMDPGLFDPEILNALDPELLREDADIREVLKACKEQAERLRNEKANTTTSTRESRRQQKIAQREAEKAEARERTLSTIYKQLAKVLHPDLERDPRLQTEKLRLMQQVTEAYRSKDLFTLLKLEVEYLRKDEGDFLSLAEDKLRIYTEVLKEQVEMLRQELAEVSRQPRFACIERYVEAALPSRPRWKELALESADLRKMIERGLVLLNSAPSVARKELQEILGEYADSKAAARGLDLDPW